MSYSGSWRLPLAHETMLFRNGNVQEEELGATSGACDCAFRGWKGAVEELNLVEWLVQLFLERFQQVEEVTGINSV